MQLAAPPANHHPHSPQLFHRRQYPPATPVPDLTFSPALSDFSQETFASPLLAQFTDALALDGGAASPTSGASARSSPALDDAADDLFADLARDPSPSMHHQHLWPASYRAPPRSTSQQPTSRSAGGDAAGASAWQWPDPSPPSAGNPPSFHLHPAYPAASAHPQHLAAPRFGGQLAGHKRNNSGSTVGSASASGPTSPFTPLSSYPHIYDADRYPSPGFLDAFGDLSTQPPAYTKPGAAPTFTDSYQQATGAYDAYLQPAAAYHADPHALAYHAAMRRTRMMAEAPSRGDEAAGPPAALQRLPTGEFDHSFEATLEARGAPVPTLTHSLSHTYQDELYPPQHSAPLTGAMPALHSPAAAGGPTRPVPQTAPLPARRAGSPHRGDPHAFAQLLQAAHSGHLRDEPAADRACSPFQRTSQYAHDPISAVAPFDYHTYAPQSAAQLRARAKAQADAQAYRQAAQRHATAEAPTISPQDAFLDANDPDADYGPPLFPTAGPRRGAPAYPAALPRAGSAHASDAAPAFRPPLVSMESTRSDAASGLGSTPPSPPSPPSHPAHSDHSSASSHAAAAAAPLPRPAQTTSAAGSYACTYAHCAARFASAAKLQKHKRDAHRPVSPPVSGDDIDDGLVHSPRTTAALLAARNAQTGPHTCDRVNPGTGKPCHAIFSRPYDLTRHEDTIHNSRKHKVRCPFCTDDKTFSRADALTRHLRVVHPERDVPGRRRRAG